VAIAFGMLPAELLTYEQMLALVQHPIGTRLVFLVISFPHYTSHLASNYQLELW